jgi:hypothetical protein
MHYLKQARSEDALANYGAFVEGNDYPFAWVSYSPVDRQYKKDALWAHGVEPNNFVELTRAWNCVWSPRNTMSALFQYAHNDLQDIWQTGRVVGKKFRRLGGVITAINPNLGFDGKAFRAVNMIKIALKPAEFKYTEKD